MPQGSPSLARRRWCRPDRAKFHAELPVLTRLKGVQLWALRMAVVDAGGEGAWEELVQLLRTGQRELEEHTGVDAMLRWLTILYSLNRCETVGYRGLIGSADAVARRASELLGLERGMSVRTLNGAARVMEHVGLLDRWVYGRGRLAQVDDPDAPPSEDGEPAKRDYKRPVSAWTLTTLAVSFWSAPRRRRRSAGPVRAEPTSANLAENTLSRKGFASLSPTGRAQTIDPCGRRRPELWDEVSPASAGDEVRHGAAATAPTAQREGPRASAVPPRRRYAWRPRPDEPNDLGNARQALLYDCETVLIRHGRRDRGDILAALEAELDPRRMLGAELSRAGPAATGPPRRTSGLEQLLGEWLWHWRELALEQRQQVVVRMILPVALAHLRRVELWRLPQLEREVAPGEIARAFISRARRTARAPDPGPRMVPEIGIAVMAPPEPVPDVRPRAGPRSPPGPEHDDAWLEDLKRRHCGEEED